MTVNIPQALGVPGKDCEPPDWFSSSSNADPGLDDVRWCGAVQLTSHDKDSSGDASFRATQAVDSGQRYIYLSFRATFVPAMNDTYDYVYLGLQKKNGTKAMVIQIQVHGPNFNPAGPPSSVPPQVISADQIQIFTRSENDASWTPQAISPTWIVNSNHDQQDQATAKARAWLHPADPPDGPDPNYRWAVELRIPAMAVGDIVSDGGPNIGTDFDMWYVIQGTGLTPSPSSDEKIIILADYRTAGETTEGQLKHYLFPTPFAPDAVWDEFLLTFDPGEFGGVAIYGNGYTDILVKNLPYGEGTWIANGLDNTFIARPRNYRLPDIDPATQQDRNCIKSGHINATFRIANYGTTMQGWTDLPSGTWDYVPGNSAQATGGDPGPVISNVDIPILASGQNPPTTTMPIRLDVQRMTLDPGKDLHQCILVTLSSGDNITFLNNSAYQNMDFHPASLMERQAEISVVGLTPVSSPTRRVYLAIEKTNMPVSTPTGTDEGRFLQKTMTRLIDRGGPLAEKLVGVQKQLSAGGDFGSGARFEGILESLRQILAETKYVDPKTGQEAFGQLTEDLTRWLYHVKEREGAAKRLAVVFDVLGKWVSITDPGTASKTIDTFMAPLSQWLSTLGEDPASLEVVPAVVQSLGKWLSTLSDGDKPAELVGGLGEWLNSGHPEKQQSEILNPISEYLASLPIVDPNRRTASGTISNAVACWLNGYERLNTFVGLLSEANLTQPEVDQLFPTFRVHVYYDTGERVTGSDGKVHQVLRVQPSFGVYAYHEGSLDGWQISIPEAKRIAENMYFLPVPNNSTSKIAIKIQAVGPGDTRLSDDPIVAEPALDDGDGCPPKFIQNMMKGRFKSK